MTEVGPSYRQSMLLLFALLIFSFGMQGYASASASCPEQTPEGKYWEYREFLIDAGTGGKSGKGKRGLKKGKGQNKIDGDGVNQALNEYFRAVSTWTTKVHAEKIEAFAPDLKGFRGASGLVGYVWLEIANDAVLHFGKDKLDKNDKIAIDVWGKINKSNTEPNTSEAGFAYNKTDGSGHVWATMCFEVRFGSKGSDQEPDATIRYSLKVEVAPCGFRVFPRGTASNPQDPVFDGSYIRWENGKVPNNFMSKLEAVNFLKGEEPGGGYNCPTPTDGYVNVTEVRFDKDGDGTWQNWKNDTKYSHLFARNLESCVDMFFDVADPPTSLDANSAKPNYCLGRCSDPPIANSGM